MKCHYSMLIQWSDEDRVFVVTLPEFGGCKTHGRTYEKAAKNGKEVLELLIQTYKADRRPLPEAATFDSAALDRRSSRPVKAKAV